MKILNKDKILFSIHGLPYSGVEEVCDVFNNIENSICLDSPIRGIHRNLIKEVSDIEEIQTMSSKTNNFITSYRDYIKEGKICENVAAGICETMSLIPGRISREMNKLLKVSDFKVFVFRHPMSVFSDWKKHSSISYRAGNDMIDSFRLNYKKAINLYNIVKKRDNVVLIKYESMKSNISNEWMNEKFKMLKFEGEIEKIYKNSIESFRDYKNDTSNLTFIERNYIASEITQSFLELD